MSSPLIVSTSPVASAVDVVLGLSITVVFNQAIDPTTVSDATFSLVGPGQTGIITPNQEIAANPSSVTGREYIPGTFSFPTSASFVYTPSRPLRPGVVYTVLLAGKGSIVATSAISNPGGEQLSSPYQFSFTTGVLNLSSPPLVSPLPPVLSYLDPNTVQIVPKPLIGNDLSQTVTLYFPYAIDTTSLDPVYSGGSQDSNPFNDIQVSVDPILGDPLVPIPSDLTFNVSITGNKLVVTVGGWPAQEVLPNPL